MDNYSKAVLTVIAACMVFQVAGDLLGPSAAQAYGSGTDVRVTNYETDISAGATLYVYCTNCD